MTHEGVLTAKAAGRKRKEKKRKEKKDLPQSHRDTEKMGARSTK
jgi:hypothetical protein